MQWVPPRGLRSSGLRRQPRPSGPGSGPRQAYFVFIWDGFAPVVGTMTRDSKPLQPRFQLSPKGKLAGVCKRASAWGPTARVCSMLLCHGHGAQYGKLLGRDSCWEGPLLGQTPAGRDPCWGGTPVKPCHTPAFMPQGLSPATTLGCKSCKHLKVPWGLGMHRSTLNL